VRARAIVHQSFSELQERGAAVAVATKSVS